MELADVLAAGHPGDELDAARTAWAVTVPGASAADPPALLRWLAAALQALAAHGPAAIGAVMAAGPPPGALRWIDGAAAAGLADVDRPAVRRLLLGAEVAEIRAGGAPPTVALPPVDVGADARRDADSEISSAILLGSDAEAEALLRLAWRHAIEPRLAPLLDRLGVFVAAGRKPVAGDDAQHWALHEEILDLAQAELRTGSQSAGPAGSVRRWPPCGLISPPAELIWLIRSPVTCTRWNCAACAPASGPSTCASCWTPRSAARRPLPPPRAGRPAAGAAVVGGHRAARSAGRAPHAAAARRHGRAADHRPGGGPADSAWVARPDSRLLGDLRYLRRCGADLSAPPLPGLLATDDEVAEFLEQARGGPASPRQVRELHPALRRLSQGDLLVLRQRVPDLLQVCLECPEPALGSAVLGALPLLAARPMAVTWAAGLRRPGDEVRTVVRGVSWLEDPGVPGEVQVLIAEAIQDVLAGLSSADREEWAASVQRMLTPGAARLWPELVAGGARPRWGLRPRAKRGK